MAQAFLYKLFCADARNCDCDFWLFLETAGSAYITPCSLLFTLQPIKTFIEQEKVDGAGRILHIFTPETHGCDCTVLYLVTRQLHR